MSCRRSWQTGATRLTTTSWTTRLSGNSLSAGTIGRYSPERKSIFSTWGGCPSWLLPWLILQSSVDIGLRSLGPKPRASPVCRSRPRSQLWNAPDVLPRWYEEAHDIPTFPRVEVSPPAVSRENLKLLQSVSPLIRPARMNLVSALRPGCSSRTKSGIVGPISSLTLLASSPVFLPRSHFATTATTPGYFRR